MNKYFKGKADISTENRVRITRLIEYLVEQESIIPTESTHGGCPAAVQRLVMRKASNLNYYKIQAIGILLGEDFPLILEVWSRKNFITFSKYMVGYRYSSKVLEITEAKRRPLLPAAGQL